MGFRSFCIHRFQRENLPKWGFSSFLDAKCSQTRNAAKRNRRRESDYEFGGHLFWKRQALLCVRASEFYLRTLYRGKDRWPSCDASQMGLSGAWQAVFPPRSRCSLWRWKLEPPAFRDSVLKGRWQHHFFSFYVYYILTLCYAPCLLLVIQRGEKKSPPTWNWQVFGEDRKIFR